MSVSMQETQPGIELDQHALHREVADLLGVELTQLAGWHINRIRPDGAIDAEVPLHSIDVAGVPTDPENVERLIGLFDDYEQEVGGTGQRDAVVIGHVPGEGFFMVDGFHRHEVQTIREKDTLNGTVEPNLSYEQVVARQLQYAQTHPEVEFARQVEWMQSVWQRSDLSKQIPNVLTAFRAFQDDYGVQNTDDVGLIDALSEKDYTAVCEWVKKKCDEWGYKPKQIRDNLARVESFDTALMHLVYQKRGVPPEGRIGLGHVEAITEIYGGEFDFQKEIVQLIVSNQLSVAQTKLLIDKIEIHSPSLASQVQRIAKSIDIRSIRAQSRIQSSGGRSSASSKSQAQKASDFDLLAVVRERLDRMSSAALDDEWSAPEAKVALEVAVGLGTIVVGLSERNVFSQQELREAKATFEKYVQDLGILCVVKESAEDKNRRRHEGWGLTFKMYDGEIAPTVVIDGKAHYDLDEIASTILYCVAQKAPRVDHPVEVIKGWLYDLGLSNDGPPRVNETSIRIAITSIDKKLRSLNKQDHVILRTAGQRKVRFGLVP